MREWMGRLRRSVRYAARGLARSPSFTITAVASLALGIAVNTTMFSVVSSLLLRPLGPRDDLVRIGRSNRGERAFRSASHQDYAYLREHASSFLAITGHQLESFRLGAVDGSQPLAVELVADGYFATLGVPPRRGREFSSDEYAVPGNQAVAIASDRFWRGRLSADSAIIGRTLNINDRSFDVIGVAPPGFSGTFPGVDVDLWVPAGIAWATNLRGDASTERSLQLIGRLREGVSIATAEAEVDVLARRISEVNADGEGERHFVVAAARGAHPLFASVLRVLLTLLMAVVGVVLLIACANVAGLLLARARARRGEIALRLGIGASRAQVVGQLLVESLMLGMLGGAFGLALSVWPVLLLNNLSFIPGPTGAGIFLDLRLETRVLVFTAAVSLLTTLVFGLVPALQATRVSLASALQNPRATTGRARFRLGSTLVVAQVGVSFVLLVGAMLFFRSLRNIDRIDVGFEPDGIFAATIDLTRLGYDRSRTERFYADLLARARELPGIEQAALAGFTAFGGGTGHPVPLRIAGVPAPAGQPRMTVAVGRVSDGYFATVQQPLLRGRDFVPADTMPNRRVAIVNEAMTRRYWPGGDAVGKRIGLGEGLMEHEVIGVVGNARVSSFGGAIAPFVFLPAFTSGRLHLRTSGQSAEVLRRVRNLVREIDSNAVPYVSGQTMRETMASSMSLIPVKIARAVLSATGIIALLLAAGGLFGLVSYTAEQRIREIGIRVALGANRGNVFRVIVGHAVRLTGIGIVMGLLVAAGATRLLSQFLYGLSPMDPLSFGAIAVLLTVVTFGAGYAAARRGLGVDPMVVLRYE
jgi:predicted permease